MTADFTYRLCQYIVNKNQDGYLTPNEFNLVINQAQLSFVNYLLGQYNQYQYGRPNPRIQYSETIQARQSLTSVIYGYNLHIDQTGFSPYPADYIQRDRVQTIYGENLIRYAPPERLTPMLKSVIDVVSNENPLFTIEQTGFRFYPNNLIYGQAKLHYVQTPPNIIWGYTLDGNGEPVYNPATSVDPVFSDTDMLYIVVRAMKIVGVSLQAGAVSQYANEVKNQGQ